MKSLLEKRILVVDDMPTMINMIVGMSSIKKSIVDFGGKISVTTKKDQGTSFHILLPYL